MLYNKEINDETKIQFIILYTLASANRPIRYDDLINIIFENCNVNYADFQIALSHLVDIEQIGKTTDEQKRDVFFMLPSGKKSNEFFENEIPAYIKIPIKKYIKPYFHEEDVKEKIKAEAIEIAENEYSVHLAIFDSDDLPLMELNFYTGGRSEALETVKKFKSDPDSVYKKITEILL